MSMFSTMSGFVQTTFTTATATVDTVGKGLDIANRYVDVNHKRLTQSMTEEAKLALAVHNERIAAQLDADANLKAQYEKVCAEWDTY